jgi:hypothetical protein
MTTRSTRLGDLLTASVLPTHRRATPPRRAPKAGPPPKVAGTYQALAKSAPPRSATSAARFEEQRKRDAAALRKRQRDEKDARYLRLAIALNARNR